jgi:hypothetical protein
MSNAIVNLDHPVIAVRDMAVARAAYERLGFTVTPRGSHLEWGTGNWCIMFPHNYLELRGITDSAKYTHHLDAYLAERGEGLMGVAFGTSDASRSEQQLTERGLHPQPIRTLTRNFELPEGNVQPRFALCFLDSNETPGLMSVVLCQHLTPGLLRRPEWMRHANGAQGVRSMTGVVTKLNDAAQIFAKVFGVESVARQNESLIIRVGPVQFIQLTTRAGLASMYPEIDTASVDAGDALAAVTLEVDDLTRTAEYFTSRAIALTHADDRAIRVAKSEACGAVLEFAAPASTAS